MQRTIGIALSKFAVTPNSLRMSGPSGAPVEQTNINLAQLFHHYYLDNYGKTPPNPDPAQFEYLSFLAPTLDFRLQSGGLGVSTAARRNRSNELGQAFCRLFLHDHLNITYFAHIEQVLNKSTHRAFDGLNIERSQTGDVPDYLCAENVRQVFIAEAKGRYSSISFNNKEFSKWREQFNRIIVRDKFRRALAIKGYIVGTRYATEDSDRIQSKIYAEDPSTRGEVVLGEGNQDPLGVGVISVHYGNIADKLNLPLLAAALLNGYTLPREIQISVIVWELTMGPFAGSRFVGGYYSKAPIRITRENGSITFNHYNPVDLMSGGITFFGLEENIFSAIVKMARLGSEAVVEVPAFDNIEPFYSGISILRDGSIISPSEFLRPIDQITI